MKVCQPGFMRNPTGASGRKLRGVMPVQAATVLRGMKPDARLATVKAVAQAVQVMALAGLARRNMMLTSAERARLRSIGFTLKHDDRSGTTGTLNKHGVKIKLEADDQIVAIDVGRQDSKTPDVSAVWVHNNLAVDIMVRTSAWPEATRVLRATLTRRAR